MAADLAGSAVTVNVLLPGGATATGMVPDDVPAEHRAGLLPADVMTAPIRWLCSAAAAGVHDERIVATDSPTGWPAGAERCPRARAALPGSGADVPALRP